MGACGCGDFGGGFSFPGPKGSTYVLEIQPWCRDCDAPGGLRILHVPKPKGQDDLARDYLDGNRPLAFQDGGDVPEAAIPVVHPPAIRRAIAGVIGDLKVVDGKDVFLLSEQLDADPDELEDAIAAAVMATMQLEAADHG